jgi:hypothetical protein
MCVGRDSSVGIATRYGLDGPGIESRWRRGIPQLTRSALESSHPPITGYWVIPGGKAAEALLRPPTPCSAEVKERVQLYLYSPSRPSWSDLVRTLPFQLYVINV